MLDAERYLLKRYRREIAKCLTHSATDHEESALIAPLAEWLPIADIMQIAIDSVRDVLTDKVN